MMGQGQNLPVPPTPPPLPQIIVQGPTPPPWVTLPPAVTLLVALGFFAACAVVLYPLFRALARRLEGRSLADDGAIRAEIDQLRQRLEDVEGLQHRMLELEERVDFAERLLATQRREAERLPGA
jgi:hypothetical protein